MATKIKFTPKVGKVNVKRPLKRFTNYKIVITAEDDYDDPDEAGEIHLEVYVREELVLEHSFSVHRSNISCGIREFYNLIDENKWNTLRKSLPDTAFDRISHEIMEKLLEAAVDGVAFLMISNKLYDEEDRTTNDLLEEFCYMSESRINPNSDNNIAIFIYSIDNDVEDEDDAADYEVPNEEGHW